MPASDSPYQFRAVVPAGRSTASSNVATVAPAAFRMVHVTFAGQRSVNESRVAADRVSRSCG